MRLIDDGTLDTVLQCEDCGEEFRYNYDLSDATDDEPNMSYDDFVQWCIEENDHECAAR